MRPEKALQFCKAKEPNWYLIDCIFRNVVEREYRILASAVFEAYHPDKEKGLKRWDGYLDGHANLLKGIARYNLRDFYNAWALASKELKDKPEVAVKISDYILEHRKKLYGIFKIGRLDIAEQVTLSKHLEALESTRNIDNKM